MVVESLASTNIRKALRRPKIDMDGRRSHEPRRWPVPRLLEGLTKRQLMASGEHRHPVDVVAGGHRRRSKGIPRVFQPLKEGYRSGRRASACPRHEAKQRRITSSSLYFRWAAPISIAKATSSACFSTAKANMEPYEWAYWMEGKPAEKDIQVPNGLAARKAGATRDGGSYDDRMGSVACWNAVMDENDYSGPQWKRVHRA